MLNQLINLRQTTDIKIFREVINDITPIELNKLVNELNSLKNRISVNYNSKFGQGLRFVCTNALGLIPGIGLITGISGGAVDLYLGNKVLKSDKVVGVTQSINKLLREG